MVFNCFNDVSLAVKLKQLFSDESVTVVEWYVEVGKIAIWFIEVGWVTEGTLVVGNGPGRSGHNSEVVVPVGVDGADQSILSAELGTIH